MNGRARASEAWCAYDDAALAPKGSGSMKRVGTSRVERSVVIRICCLWAPHGPKLMNCPTQALIYMCTAVLLACGCCLLLPTLLLLLVLLLTL